MGVGVRSESRWVADFMAFWVGGGGYMHMCIVERGVSGVFLDGKVEEGCI